MEFLNLEIDKATFIKILVCFLVLIVIYMMLTMSSLLIFKSYTLGANTEVVEDKALVFKKGNVKIEFLEQCVNTIKEQTFKDLEVLVINNGSAEKY